MFQRLIALLVLLTLMAHAFAQGTSNEITGTIRDMDSGKPVAGAEVTVSFGWQPYSAVTDSAGVYLIRTNVQHADGNFPVRVLREGYYDLNGFIRVSKRSGFDFSLKQAVKPVEKPAPKDTLPAITLEGLPVNNWVFLLDVSASMNVPEKLPLVQAGMKGIVELFRGDDQVAIVTFSGTAKEILPSTRGTNKDLILQAVSNIQPGGKSEGEAAVNTAYATALQQYIPGGNNRIIIATDGLFTAGDKDLKAIRKTIEKYLDKDIRCSILIVGKPGELAKLELQKLAAAGNGNFKLITDEAGAVQALFEETQSGK